MDKIMKNFKNRLMIMVILLTVSFMSANLGAQEKVYVTAPQWVILEALIYGQCEVMKEQLKLEENAPIYIAYWMEFSEQNDLNLERFKAKCTTAELNTESRYEKLGKIVSRETF